MRIRYALILCAVLLLAIPLNASADTLYKVRKGDNLSRIAKRFHVKAEKIVSANGLESDRLVPGTRLTIPSSRKTSPDKVAAPAVPPQETRSLTAEADEPFSPSSGTYDTPADPESRLARELMELAGSPVVKEIKELSEPVTGENGVGGIKARLVRIAQKMLDIPYRFGGSSFLGIDCSAYVQKVFSLLDIMLPRTAREQFRRGIRVGKDELSIGDLVFFRTYAKFPSHVGIYLGDNRFIHASSSERKVTIDSLDAPYFVKRFIGARRLPLNDPAEEI